MKRMRKLAAVGLVLMCTLSMLSLSANACYNAGTSCWDESCENFEYASISDDEVMERAAVCMICREGYLRYKVITIPKPKLVTFLAPRWQLPPYHSGERAGTALR